MIQPKDRTEDLLSPITKNCETLIEQTNEKPQESLEFKLTKSKEIFSLNPSFILDLHSEWMVGLMSLEVYHSILNSFEENQNSNFLQVSLTLMNFHMLN